jgi:hypothetical protein
VDEDQHAAIDVWDPNNPSGRSSQNGCWTEVGTKGADLDRFGPNLGLKLELPLRPCVPRTNKEGAMLRRKSRLDQEVFTWLAGLDAALVMEMLRTGDDFAKCVFNAAWPPAVALHALVSTDVGMAAEVTGRGGA